jgi:predicted DNA-binding transcriptional regulator YafY
MSDTAAAQLRRILDLIPRLADGEEHPIAAVARATRTNPADVLRDLESVSERFDAPGGFVEGVNIFVDDGNVCVNAMQFHRPMRLTMPELCALELGLTMLRRERTPAEQAPVDRALERLRRTISRVPADDRHEGIRHADLSVAGAAEHLAVLRSAVATNHRVALRYRAGGATETTTRAIDPHSLVFAEQMWYVVASTGDSTLRIFRLDRVEAVAVLDETFERDPSAGLRVQEAGRAFVSGTARHMTVRYSPRIARWVAEREQVPLDADGSLTLEHPVADEAWAVRHVLQYGPDAEVLAPDAMRELVSERLREVTARTTG